MYEIASIMLLAVFARYYASRLWFCSALSNFAQTHTFAIFSMRRRGFDFVLRTCSDFSPSLFTDFSILFLSLPFSSFAYPIPFCNLADPEHHPSIGIHNERTRERTNFESGCPKGRKSLGRGRRVKGRKNIPKPSVRI